MHDWYSSQSLASQFSSSLFIDWQVIAGLIFTNLSLKIILLKWTVNSCNSWQKNNKYTTCLVNRQANRTLCNLFHHQLGDLWKRNHIKYFRHKGAGTTPFWMDNLQCFTLHAWCPFSFFVYCITGIYLVEKYTVKTGSTILLLHHTRCLSEETVLSNAKLKFQTWIFRRPGAREERLNKISTHVPDNSWLLVGEQMGCT